MLEFTNLYREDVFRKPDVAGYNCQWNVVPICSILWIALQHTGGALKQEDGGLVHVTLFIGQSLVEEGVWHTLPLYEHDLNQNINNEL